MKKIILAVLVIWALSSCTRPYNRIICPRPPTQQPPTPVITEPYIPPPEIVPTYLQPTAAASQVVPPAQPPEEEATDAPTAIPYATIPSRINPPTPTATPYGDAQGGVCWFW